MTIRDDWNDRSKRFLKAELKRADVTYEDLAKRLSEVGMPETKGSITVKINRGGFTGGFFLAALSAVGCKVVRLEDV
jgi:hypothetical protein